MTDDALIIAGTIAGIITAVATIVLVIYSIKQSEKKKEVARRAYFVKGKEKAEEEIKKILEYTEEGKEIFGVFHDATFSPDIREKIENAAQNGAIIRVLMPCEEESTTGAKWLYNKVGKLGDVLIHNYSDPIPTYKDAPKRPGNFRMLLNSKTHSCLLGIADPYDPDYYGIVVIEETFFDFMRISFLDQFKKYKKFEYHKNDK